MSSSSVSSSTTRTTQATRKQLKPADSRQTCHSAALLPQHGFRQLDLSWGRSDEKDGKKAVRRAMCTERSQVKGIYNNNNRRYERTQMVRWIQLWLCSVFRQWSSECFFSRFNTNHTIAEHARWNYFTLLNLGCSTIILCWHWGYIFT